MMVKSRDAAGEAVLLRVKDNKRLESVEVCMVGDIATVYWPKGRVALAPNVANWSVTGR